MAFLNLYSELAGTLTGLSPILAQTHINRAWDDVRRARNWSFLQSEGALVCPAQITTGAFSITQFSNQVTANAAASTALLAQDATQPALTNLQIRFGGTGNAAFSGQVYWITAVDQTNPAAIVLTLSRVVVEATNATSTYQCYRAFTAPPSSDFLCWQSITDMVNGWTLKLNSTSVQLNRIDPQRQSQGMAYYCAAYRGNELIGSDANPDINVDAGTPLYELWPAATSGQTFWVEYRRLGQPFVNPTDQQPVMIPDQLIVTRALGWYSYYFAQANKANFPAFKGVNFVELALNAQRLYGELLNSAFRNDDEAQLQTVYATGHGLRWRRGIGKGIQSFPIDSNFIQSHLLNI